MKQKDIKGLSDTEQRVLQEYQVFKQNQEMLKNLKKTLIPHSVVGIAKKLSLHRVTVHTAISKLKEEGYIS